MNSKGWVAVLVLLVLPVALCQWQLSDSVALTRGGQLVAHGASSLSVLSYVGTQLQHRRILPQLDSSFSSATSDVSPSSLASLSYLDSFQSFACYAPSSPSGVVAVARALPFASAPVLVPLPSAQLSALSLRSAASSTGLLHVACLSSDLRLSVSSALDASASSFPPFAPYEPSHTLPSPQSPFFLLLLGASQSPSLCFQDAQSRVRLGSSLAVASAVSLHHCVVREDGSPAILFSSEAGGLQLVSALDSSGSSWGSASPVTAAPPHSDLRAARALFLASVLHVAYARVSDNSVRVLSDASEALLASGGDDERGLNMYMGAYENEPVLVYSLGPGAVSLARFITPSTESTCGCSSPDTYSLATLPSAIPDASATQLFLAVAPSSSAPSTITCMEVFVDIAHPWILDVSVTLRSPSGTSVVIVQRPCGASTANLRGTFSSEEGTTPLPCPPVLAQGEYPAFPAEGDLSAFYGEDPRGIWTVVVTDCCAQDIGLVSDFRLKLCTAQSPTTAPPPVCYALNQDNRVGIDDLAILLLQWGECSPSSTCYALNQDNAVGIDDLAILLLQWGECPPGSTDFLP